MPFTPAPNSLQGHTILITGGNTGLGLESAKRLAVGGAHVILTARTVEKGQKAVQQVTQYLEEHQVTQIGKITYQILRLDNIQQLKNDVAQWIDEVEQIDVLLNNAGVMAIPDRRLTVDGLELQIQTNHLGPFLLTYLLLPKLTPNARIINLTSEAHRMTRGSGGLDWDYLWKAEHGYGGWKSYGQSKLANILFTQELQRRIDAAGQAWTTMAVHPGVIATDLYRHLTDPSQNTNDTPTKTGPSLHQRLWRFVVSWFVTSIEQGATTQIWLASGMGDGSQLKGQYVVNNKVRSLHAFAMDAQKAQRSWQESEHQAGIQFQIPNASKDD